MTAKRDIIAFTPSLQIWLRSGERGQSSETMVEVFEELPTGFLTGRWGHDHPHDPSDFRRCIALLEAVPAYRGRLDELRDVSLVWNLLVEHWDQLETLLNEEAPKGHGAAPRLYDEMKRLIQQAGEKW